MTEALKAGGGQADLFAITQYVQQNAGTEKAIFAYPRNDSLVVKAILGMPTKSSTPEHIRIGHNPDTVYVEERQAQLAAKSTPLKNEKDDDDDDDDSNNSGAALDFGSYMKKMKKDIQSKWAPPKGFNAERVIAVFTITKDGRIVEPQIVESSGKENIDQLALQALSQASPLDPLPKGSPSSVQIRYQFDWSVH
jgi:TonB family protein